MPSLADTPNVPWAAKALSFALSYPIPSATLALYDPIAVIPFYLLEGIARAGFQL